MDRCKPAFLLDTDVTDALLPEPEPLVVDETGLEPIVFNDRMLDETTNEPAPIVAEKTPEVFTRMPTRANPNPVQPTTVVQEGRPKTTDIPIMKDCIIRLDRIN